MPVESTPLKRAATLRLPLLLCALCLNYGGDGFFNMTHASTTSASGGRLGLGREQLIHKVDIQDKQEGHNNLWRSLFLAGGALSALGALHRRRTLSASRAAEVVQQPSKTEESWALALARSQIVGICCILAAQYTMLLIFGVYGSELLDPGDANKLYAAASWGACFLAAPAGLCFDALGPAWSTLIGGVLSAFGLGTAALVLGTTHGAASLVLASLGYLLFGFGATLLNTVGLLAAVRVAPSQHSGKAAACVLCSAALGISLHTAVHAKWCSGAPFKFINYQIMYSISSALLGFLIFRSRAWKMALAEVEQQEANDAKSSSEDSPKSQSSSATARICSILKNKDFPWLAAIYLIPIAYCFAWLGNWPVCATSLGLSPEAQTRIGLSVGLFSALGRVIFGLLGDWVPRGRGLVGLELGFTASLGLFASSFLLLGIDQRLFFESAMRLQSLGYGGVLCLAAVALRASFSGEDLGTAFGFLYQILTVTFMFFNWACVPSSNCVGAECFKGFFNLSGLLHGGCVLWGARRLMRAYAKRVASDPKSP